MSQELISAHSVCASLSSIATAGSLVLPSQNIPLHRKREDPDYATQSHDDHMRALASATRSALQEACISGDLIEAIALDTTGSSVIPVAADLSPLDDYYLWCDHRAKKEARQITELAHREKLEAIQWCGGVYSSEWGFAKLLHWLRNNPAKRDKFASAFEHCDMVAATLCGVTNPADAKRSVCAMGHKWMWNAGLGGLPSESFLAKVDPLLAGVRKKLDGDYATSDKIAGKLSPQWAEKLGLRAGIPIPVGAFDAHWDAIGAGAKQGDVVNVVGTSTCIIAYAKEAELIPGVCGVVKGSVHPKFTGVEAGLSATGDIFSAIAKRANTTVDALSKGLEQLSRRANGIVALDLGQRRSDRPGQSESRRDHSGLEPAAYSTGRTVRGDRRNRVPYTRDSRSYERIRRAYNESHQRRRHPAE